MNNRTIFLAIAVILGLWLAFPKLNYQELLAQGDHGRDLYSYQLAAEGKLPYRDFQSSHGPLMFFYYALFYKLFGVNIQSVLLGHQLLIVLTGVVIFRAGTIFLSPLLSLNCALWYWIFRGSEFFYTYNHNGAALMMALTLLSLFKYMETKKPLYTYWGAVSLFLLSLIRPNIALACTVSFYASLLLWDYFLKEDRWKNILLYTAQCVTILCGSFFIYWALTAGLPAHVAAHDLAYWKHTFGAKVFHNVLALIAAPLEQFRLSRKSALMILAILLSSIHALKLLFTNKLSAEKSLKTKLIIACLLLFTVLNLCEYLLHIRFFRVYWSFIPVLLLVFVFFDVSLKSIKLSTAKILISGLCLFTLYSGAQHLIKIKAEKAMNNVLHIGGNRIYLSSKQDPQWIKTVQDAVGFIQQRVPAGEKIVAIRNDALYFFLSNRYSATDDFYFPWNQPEREQYFLQQMKDNHTRYVIVSNRSFKNTDYPDKVFGVTYGIEVYRYLTENYAIAATFGNWEETAEYINHHAVRIYEKKMALGH